MLQNYPLHENALLNQPIGVMDSGVGGISVLKHIEALLPNESLYYAADSFYAPYGNKTAEEIQARCVNVATFLIEKNVKALVVACNTATAAAIDHLRASFSLPIIGMEPAVKPAAAATKTGVIGILATTGTLKSAQFAALLESYGRDVKVVTQACVGLVECIERGELTAGKTYALVKSYCQPLLDAGADTIVLGCTHYPFIKPLIEKFLAEIYSAEKIILIDTGSAVAKQLQRRLDSQQLLAHAHDGRKILIYTNSDQPNAQKVIQLLWGKTNLDKISVANF